MIRQHFFSTTFFAKILRHSTKFLRFFIKICRKTLSMTVFFDNIFRQHFSLIIFYNNFRQQFFSTINFDNIFRIAWKFLAKFVKCCRKKLYYTAFFASKFLHHFLTAFFAKIFRYDSTANDNIFRTEYQML